ncbi:M28 family peptidase [Pseudoxanthomonas wuyuanensis]|uniref:Peptidase family M28 n=1 Tax=Pseudoxanthomonas wuyuanensis TaxID=1073196 RepID=A0A286CZQ9_9GAMM|nr:M28 family peptidase [Pseudoxanthomonas wuyuanensis]SOD51867.1 Peptidase family M28 [Pseudoxanthomonas wuyuanensis]
MRLFRIFGALPWLLALSAAPALADNPAAGSWQQQVAAVSAGRDSLSRGHAITARLDALGIQWRREAFERDGKRGSNLLADLGGPAGAPLLLIGAHYDKVEIGHGATDNASGVAAVLELAAALKARPLTAHRVQVAFWDLEEHGLLGSHAWVETPDRERPALYVNFDVFGWGDTLWMMSPNADTPLIRSLREAASAQQLGFAPGERYPPTDHLAFLNSGWPAVSFSLVGGDEIDAILAVFGGQNPPVAPKVMQVIHSARDTIAEIDAVHIGKALTVVERGLRDWDSANR